MSTKKKQSEYQQSIFSIVGQEACQIMDIEVDRKQSSSGSDTENNKNKWTVIKTKLIKQNVQYKKHVNEKKITTKSPSENRNEIHYNIRSPGIGLFFSNIEQKIIGNYRYQRIHNPRLNQEKVKEIKEQFLFRENNPDKQLKHRKSLYNTFTYKNTLIYENQILSQFFKTAIIQIKKRRKKNNEQSQKINIDKNKRTPSPPITNLTKIRRKSCYCNICGNTTGMEVRTNYIYPDLKIINALRVIRMHLKALIKIKLKKNGKINLNKKILLIKRAKVQLRKKRQKNEKDNGIDVKEFVNSVMITLKKDEGENTIKKKQKTLFKNLSVIDMYKQMLLRNKRNILNSVIQQSEKQEQSGDSMERQIHKKIQTKDKILKNHENSYFLVNPKNINKYSCYQKRKYPFPFLNKKTLNNEHNSSAQQLQKELPSLRYIPSKQNIDPPRPNRIIQNFDTQRKLYYMDKESSQQSIIKQTSLKNLKSSQESRRERQTQGGGRERISGAKKIYYGDPPRTQRNPVEENLSHAYYGDLPKTQRNPTDNSLPRMRHKYLFTEHSVYD